MYFCNEDNIGIICNGDIIKYGRVYILIYQESDNGWLVTNAYGAATQTVDGLMSAVDKAKLDGIEAGATAVNNIYYGICNDKYGHYEEKTVECNDFVLDQGVRIVVLFSTDNLAENPSLNINNTGAKPIYLRGNSIPKNYIVKNTPYEFYYNGTQYELINSAKMISEADIKLSEIGFCYGLCSEIINHWDDDSHTTATSYGYSTSVPAYRHNQMQDGAIVCFEIEPFPAGVAQKGKITFDGGETFLDVVDGTGNENIEGLIPQRTTAMFVYETWTKDGTPVLRYLGSSIGGSVSGVSGVKGAAESSYRTGDVELTLGNMGITWGNTDLTAGTSALATGQIYLYYE